MINKFMMSICVFLLNAILYIELNAMDYRDGSVSWAVSSRQSDRDSMEDARSIVHNFQGDPRRTFAGLYDGHSGDRASRYASEYLHRKLAENLSRISDTRTALSRSFLEVDADIRRQFYLAGTTALVAYLVHHDMHVAWAGDSRALVVRRGNVVFATDDHKPNSEGERQRIEQAGAQILFPYGIARANNGVYGSLSVSRSLGDQREKDHLPGAIIAVPDIKSTYIEPDDIIVLACDGVWDQLSNEDVAFIIQATLERRNQEEIVERFVQKNKISPYYGDKAITEYLYLEGIVRRGLCDEMDRYRLQELSCEVSIGRLLSGRQTPEILKRMFIEELADSMPFEIMETTSSTEDLGCAAERIRDFSWAFGAQSNRDNLSVVLLRKN